MKKEQAYKDANERLDDELNEIVAEINKYKKTASNKGKTKNRITNDRKKSKNNEGKNKLRELQAKNKNTKVAVQPKIDKTKNRINSKVNTKVSKKSIKGGNLVRSIFFLIFLALFIFSLVNLIRWKMYSSKSENLIKNIISESVSDDNLNSDDATNKNPIDFEKLKEENSDVVAWINIPNTSINYPVVQAEDNDYYLYKDFDKNYSTCGWIFMDKSNNKDLIDCNTVLYGHNLKSGLMFKDLTKIYNGTLGNEIYIEIYTKNMKNTYKVFSSYMTEPEDYAINTKIVTEYEQQKYIKEMLSRNINSYNVVPSSTDKVLTLSTCDNTGKNRILVHSVLVESVKYEN